MGVSTNLAKGALANSAVKVKVVKVDLAVKVDGVAAATKDCTHANRR